MFAATPLTGNQFQFYPETATGNVWVIVLAEILGNCWAVDAGLGKSFEAAHVGLFSVAHMKWVGTTVSRLRHENVLLIQHEGATCDRDIGEGIQLEEVLPNRNSNSTEQSTPSPCHQLSAQVAARRHVF